MLGEYRKEVNMSSKAMTLNTSASSDQTTSIKITQPRRKLPEAACHLNLKI